jgi:hypothetical protein
MFDRWKTCRVEAFGEPQQRYEKHQTLWIERGEDMYAMDQYKLPFCILQRQDWLRGTEVPE